jgi:hypothetical protein
MDMPIPMGIGIDIVMVRRVNIGSQYARRNAGESNALQRCANAR